MTDFQTAQRLFTAHMRDPEKNPAPTDIEDRRMGIYRDLIYNNIEGFLSGGFPILREIHEDDAWHALVRTFIREHQCHTPYFLEISQEFLRFLQQRPVPEDKPFMVELAHYEWVELALDVSTETIPDNLVDGDLLALRPVVSPLTWNLSYQFPVHQISSKVQPRQVPDTPTFLVVYRNRRDQVKFMESNAATSRLLNLLEGDSSLSGRQALVLLAEEMSAPDPEAVIQFGHDTLRKLRDLDVICGCR
jgi:hypothetical protein